MWNPTWAHQGWGGLKEKPSEVSYVTSPSKAQATGAPGTPIVESYPECSWITMETAGPRRDAPLELVWNLLEDSK